VNAKTRKERKKKIVNIRRAKNKQGLLVGDSETTLPMRTRTHIDNIHQWDALAKIARLRSQKRWNTGNQLNFHEEKLKVRKGSTAVT
jgi:hypothetical protein